MPLTEVCIPGLAAEPFQSNEIYGKQNRKEGRVNLKTIQCRAAVAWEAKKPLSIENVEVAPPKSGEVRIKMYYAGVCHSDAHHLDDVVPATVIGRFPIIIGHEGSGIVESVGDDVTEFKPGDHVIPNFLAQCGDCKICRNAKSNICQLNQETQLKGLMPDGTSRFSCKGKTLLHFGGCSTFSEYTVVTAVSLSKINAAAPLKNVCLIGCCIPTGYGAAVNTGKVEKGSVCAVWGLGGVGLAAVMGCQHAGASRIFAIDINPDKFEKAKEFGATDFLNPKDYDKPIQQVLIEKTDGGLDFSFECIGIVATMEAALEAVHPLWGVAVVVGIAPAGKRISANPFDLLLGRTWKGTYFGGYKSKESIPALVEDYVSGKLKVDEFITHRMGLDKINEAFDIMRAGKSIRSVITLSEE